MLRALPPPTAFRPLPALGSALVWLLCCNIHTRAKHKELPLSFEQSVLAKERRHVGMLMVPQPLLTPRKHGCMQMLHTFQEQAHRKERCSAEVCDSYLHLNWRRGKSRETGVILLYCLPEACGHSARPRNAALINRLRMKFAASGIRGMTSEPARWAAVANRVNASPIASPTALQPPPTTRLPACLPPDLPARLSPYLPAGSPLPSRPSPMSSAQ